MPVYKSSEQLSEKLQTLFDRIGSQDPQAGEAVVKSRLLIRLRTTNPTVEILVNGRTNPVRITYGETKLNPDLDIELAADVLHKILMDELSLKKAFTGGKLKVRGPVMKSFVLEGIFRQGQEYYPQIFEE